MLQSLSEPILFNCYSHAEIVSTPCDAGRRLVDIAPYNTFIKIEKARNVSDVAAVKFRFEGAMMRFCDTDESIVKMIERNGAYGKYANTLISTEDYNMLKNRIKYRETNKGAR